MRGTIVQRKDGRWMGSVDLPKIDGKRKRKTIYGKSHDEVEMKLTDIVYELNHNIYTDPKNATFEEVIKEWLQVHKNTIESTTYESYVCMINFHIIPALGSVKLKELLPATIQRFYAQKLKTHSGNTVLKLHSYIKQALEFAKNNRIVKENLCNYVAAPKKSKHKAKIMDEQSFKYLLNLAQGTFDEICIVLSAVCGLRRSEVFGLRWCDIDYENNKISIEKAMVKFNKYTIKKTKTHAGTRTFNVPSFVINILREYKKTCTTEYVCAKYKPDSYSKHYRKLLESNNLPYIPFKNLRHFNASIMRKYDIDIKTAQGRLGHANASTTMEIYTIGFEEMDKKAAQILDNIFKSDNQVDNPHIQSSK